MLGRLGKTALASAALGNTVFFFSWLIGCGPVAAVAPMIAHILGAQPERSRRRARRSCAWVSGRCWSCRLPLIALLLFTQPILLLLGQKPELAAGAGRFTGALCFGLPFSLGYQVLRNFSTALSRPNASLYVMAIGDLLQRGRRLRADLRPFRAAGLGLVGAGIASACSYAFSFFAMSGVVWLTPKLRKYPHLPPLPSPALGRSLWRSSGSACPSD